MKNCPYCGGSVKPPKINKNDIPARAHGVCLACDRRPRAVITWGKNDVMYISYVREGRRPSPPEEVKSRIISKRMTEREYRAVMEGRAALTGNGNGVIIRKP